ncbi:hypothetical protein [Thalassotalea sp. ND16A]|uniref:hypothetical protein n=1 Tax=Thalassotalea sp. ND16A TaxID=1535422 RepID=UPI00136336F9|nr:hypothetical protein [Thalassotalea sp. ND16A]
MFQRTEYIESYVMVPLARKMLTAPELKAEFEQQFPRGNKIKQAIFKISGIV